MEQNNHKELFWFRWQIGLAFNASFPWRKIIKTFEAKLKLMTVYNLSWDEILHPWLSIIFSHALTHFYPALTVNPSSFCQLFVVARKRENKQNYIWLSYIWRHLRRSGVFIVNFEHISHLFLVFLMLTSNR